MICPRPNTHDPSPTAVPIKEAIKVFMPRPQLFIRQKPQFRSIRVPLFCRDPSPSHVTVAKSRLHLLTEPFDASSWSRNASAVSDGPRSKCAGGLGKVRRGPSDTALAFLD